MDKKVLNNIVYGMVDTLRTQHGLDEVEARSMIGLALRINRSKILSSIQLPTIEDEAPAASDKS